MKTNDVEEEIPPLKRKKQIEPMDNYSNMSIKDLLTDGIEEFFLKENPQNSYPEWFDVMRKRLTKNRPYIYKRFVLVKVSCKNPNKAYYLNSHDGNNFLDDETELNIFHKGWRHKTTTVSILHPNHVNKCLTMKKDLKDNDCHGWKAHYVSKEYIDEDGCFIIVGLKK